MVFGLGTRARQPAEMATTVDILTLYQDMKREYAAASRSMEKLGIGLAAMENFLPIQPTDGNDPGSWDICQEISGLKMQIAQCNALLKEVIRTGQHHTEELPQLIPVPLAMAGDVMRHASKIASHMIEMLGQNGRVAVMKTLPVSAADAQGLWVIRLHRVPSRLQVDAILQEEDAAPRSNTILILLHNKVPAMRASQHASEAQCKTDAVSWSRLTAAFAVVTEMFFKEDELLKCSQNEAAISTAVSVITGSGI